ncbi:MAG: BON domain-containing protein [Actinomycetota bacterium]
MTRSRRSETLADRVEAALADDFLLDESQLYVEVTDDVVTLAGTVETYAEKVLAQHAAQRVAEVHDLVNAIDVRPEATRHPNDRALHSMVERVLTWDALVPEDRVTIDVTGGLVALTGTCATRAQAEEAERVVSRLYGVRGVVNRIDVAPAEPDPRSVRSAIEEALRRRAAHQASQLDVVVNGAAVTVRGTVASSGQRRAVVGAAGHAPGVEEIHDELDIDDRPERYSVDGG